ncbi:hypothetical protein MKW94_010198 [Papaver nudicaule]|uniref:diphosphoinositol-polyphosphate diphosphatase n=1 Tax=Papaver nudicaule TaxID=74823 RepID=A0AA41S0I5_PAPNU|nr:hypothetical protein [Papaver nudicaule]
MGSLVEVKDNDGDAGAVIVTPLNFTIVETGIYRCGFLPGFPEPCYFAYIQALNLKSIVCLCLEQFPEETVKFLQANNIKLFQFGILGGTVDPMAPLEDETARSIRKRKKKDMIHQALKVLVDERNHPILIHCRHGLHRTGIVVGCYRKLKHNWSLPCVLEEYQRLAGETARRSDMRFIENYECYECETQQDAS